MAQKRISQKEAKRLLDKGFRKCVVCKEIKSLDLFYKNKFRHGGYGYECKKCKDAFHKKYIAQPEIKKKLKLIAKKSRKKYKKELLNKRYLKQYGITSNQKKEMLKEQNNSCKICGKEINMITGHIDHNHKTGEIRGLLCGKCNLGIGHFDDDIKLITKIIKYLNESSIRKIQILKGG